MKYPICVSFDVKHVTQLQQLRKHVSTSLSSELITYVLLAVLSTHPHVSFSFPFPLSLSSVPLLSHFFLPFLSFLLVIKARALHVLSRHSATEPHLQSLCFFS